MLSPIFIENNGNITAKAKNPKNYSSKFVSKIRSIKHDSILTSKKPKETNTKKEQAPKPQSKEDLNIECQYCSLLVDSSEIEEHEKMCGSRTVQCEICGKYIYVRLIKQHMN